MGRPLTESEKKQKAENILRVKKVIKAAGGPAVVGERFRVPTDTVFSWGRNGKIPEKYYLDLIAMTKYKPSFVHPGYYNKRHSAFQAFISRTT